MAARLASPDAFRAAGLQFNNSLAGLRMAVQERGGRHFIRVTSSTPINEPFVDLMVELNWASRQVRARVHLPARSAGTARLAPDGRRRQLRELAGRAGGAAPAPPRRPAQSAQPAPAARSQRAAPRGPAPVAPSAGHASGRRRRQRQRTRRTARHPFRWTRQPASSARRFQRRLRTRVDGRAAAIRSARSPPRDKPVDATLEQTIVAIYQANRSAFIDNNPNLIRQGRTLSIPDAAAIAAVDAERAQRQLRVAAQDFRAYKERLAGAATAVPSASSTGTTASGIGDRAGRRQRRHALASPDRLELSKSTGRRRPGAARSVRAMQKRASPAMPR